MQSKTGTISRYPVTNIGKQLEDVRKGQQSSKTRLPFEVIFQPIQDLLPGIHLVQKHVKLQR